MLARLLLLGVAFACSALSARGQGMLVPTDRGVLPLVLVGHRVSASIDDQVAVTTIEQTFRNHTSQPQEATYIFPVPKGASVDKFALWIDGKETAGELLDAKKAAAIYTEIVRRTRDPGLLENIGTDLMRIRIFPVPPHGDQKVKVRYTSVAPLDAGLVEYSYPFKTDTRTIRALDDFSMTINIKSSNNITSVYSPTHSIIVRKGGIVRADGSQNAIVTVDNTQSLTDKDFQLFYGVGTQDIGITPLTYRPVAAEDGYFLFLISPQLEMTDKNRIPQDLVMVLDTSGSMSDVKMAQAKKALKHCLNNMNKQDRFAIINFATAVRTFKDDLLDATPDHLELANKWVDDLRQSGGTAILPALNRALDFRPGTTGRPFTLVFFTDGMPTVDETDPAKIVKAITGRATSDTRIFTFGVGDDVNAAMLDQLAEATRAASTYVRPAEDIEVKVSSLHAKISHPAMTNVKLTTAGNVRLSEIYPVRLPDLFHNSQLVVMGRYSGQGSAAVKLTGSIGKENREIVYELPFPGKTDGKDFVEPLWARRKVGYLLDQIRVNGESKELVEEVVKLAKKYGIATPYTSYLVVPDGPMPLAVNGRSGSHIRSMQAGVMPLGGAGGFVPMSPGAPAPNSADVARKAAGEKGGAGESNGISRGAIQDKQADDALRAMKPEDRKGDYAKALEETKQKNADFNAAAGNYKDGRLTQNQTGRLGVDLALSSEQLRNQTQITATANRAAYGRNCIEVGGVWIDEAYEKTMPMLAIKAQSDAYFQLLEQHPQMKEVYKLGNHIVWVTPNRSALVIDANQGKEKLDAAEIEGLFAAKK